ncbi:hypothetical protein [Shewanella sp. MBTL60-007]|uniref:PFGI-1 class ICE element type IV pilus protein PilL2 n=1 Tax=Shewanella sp. MBTL60-007 TaxID=2815911 RepID=UPI001BC1CF3B|nr:hypothetical protein [Shewanella sp. MBTL60-007]GIU31279.1 hypothetical protein TUM3792_42870 [Shewanella sp. MBTL60-007]
MKITRKQIPIALTALLCSSTVCAQDVSVEPREIKKLSRYTNTYVDKNVEQANPLKTVISIKYPAQIIRISQALNYALNESGYTLLSPTKTSSITRIMYDLELPKTHREFNQQTLESVLQILAGSAFLMLVDPIKREVSFIPSIEYSTAETNVQMGVSK